MQVRLAQTVAEQMRNMIISNHITVGEKLPTESELMAHYSVSRSTIREAVKILQAENIVEVRHGLGSFVAADTGVSKDPLGLSFADQTRLLMETMEVRLLLEPDTAALAAQRRTEEDLLRMRKAVDQMEAAAMRGEDYHSYDYQFHISIAQATQNSVVTRMFPVIFDAIEKGYAQTAHVKGSFARAINYHREILDALTRQEAQTAQALLQLHIRQTLRDITNQMEGEPK